MRNTSVLSNTEHPQDRFKTQAGQKGCKILTPFAPRRNDTPPFKAKDALGFVSVSFPDDQISPTHGLQFRVPPTTPSRFITRPRTRTSQIPCFGCHSLTSRRDTTYANQRISRTGGFCSGQANSRPECIPASVCDAFLAFAGLPWCRGALATEFVLGCMLAFGELRRELACAWSWVLGFLIGWNYYWCG